MTTLKTITPEQHQVINCLVANVLNLNSKTLEIEYTDDYVLLKTENHEHYILNNGKLLGKAGIPASKHFKKPIMVKHYTDTLTRPVKQ